MVTDPSKSPTQPQAKKSGSKVANKTENRMNTRNNGVRPAVSVVAKPDPQFDKRSLEQPSEPLQKAYTHIDEQQKSLEQRLQKMSEDNRQTFGWQHFSTHQQCFGHQTQGQLQYTWPREERSAFQAADALILRSAN